MPLGDQLDERVADRPLRLHNTMTRRLERFVPRVGREAGVYSCGPTVYAAQHIGNMRAYVFVDTLKRVLRSKGYRVRHVMPITDVGHLTSDADAGEDKMELAARRERQEPQAVAEHYTRLFKQDLLRLRVADADIYAKASEHVDQMIRFVAHLEATGWCYQLPSGLYFDTSKDPRYGQLARLNLAGQLEGARVEPIEGKRHSSDFALWRTSPPGTTSRMGWDSPWGRGIPGWHLECSVMSILYLGAHFDIHTGGVDHIPVHHTNEIAQSEAYLGDGEGWVRFWLHCEFVNLNRAKISKSTGGGVCLSDLIEVGYHPVVYRYLLLQAHYRSPVEFSWEALDAARTGLRRLLERYATSRNARPTSHLGTVGLSYAHEFDAAICDDLNTARALAAVAGAAKDPGLSDPELAALAVRFEACLAIGLSDLEPADIIKHKPARPLISEEEITQMVAQRSQARTERDFTRADQFRQRLSEHGVDVEDHPDGTSTWHWQPSS